MLKEDQRKERKERKEKKESEEATCAIFSNSLPNRSKQQCRLYFQSAIFNQFDVLQMFIMKMVSK